MPETPDRKIEELLRAYAAKRREEIGAPLELHPAARRLLQAEVARLHRRRTAPPATWWNSLAVLWPRLAFAAAVFAVLGLCAWWLVPRSEPALEMARNEAPKQPLTVAKSLAENGQSIRSAEPSRASAAADDLEAKLKGQTLDAPASPPPQPVPARPRAVAPRGTTDPAKAVDKGKQFNQLAVARPAAPAAPTASGLGVADRDLGGVRYSQDAEVGVGTSRSDLVTQFAPSASVRLKSSSVRQVDASALGGAGQPELEALQVQRVFSGLQTNTFERLDAVDGLSLAYDPARIPTGKVQWNLNQGGPTQAFFGAAYSPLVPEIRSRPSQARSEAGSERISPGNTMYEAKAASGSGRRVSAQAEVAATAKPEPVAVPSSRVVGQKAAEVTDLAGGVRHHFVTAPWAAPERSRARMLAPLNALSSFDFERSGDRVSIVDADGSVYAGSVVNEHEPTPRAFGGFSWMKQEAVGDQSRGNLAAREASRPEQPGRQVLVFQVTGTNRTLNQPVVMRGMIRYSGDMTALGDASQPRGQPAAPPAVTSTAGRNLTRTASASSDGSELQLEGRLRIGTNESDFRAVRRLLQGK